MLLLAGGAGRSVSATFQSGQRPTTLRQFTIPGHGILQLAMPNGWKVSSEFLEQPPAVILHITPRGGDAFDVQMTALWLDAATLANTTAQSLKADLQRSANAVLQGAVEKNLAIQELRGLQSTGIYFALTDANPGSGEYKFLTQGIFLTGELLATFTILSRTPGAPEVGQALRIIFRDARYSQ